MYWKYKVVHSIVKPFVQGTLKLLLLVIKILVFMKLTANKLVSDTCC